MTLEMRNWIIPSRVMLACFHLYFIVELELYGKYVSQSLLDVPMYVAWSVFMKNWLSMDSEDFILTD